MSKNTFGLEITVGKDIKSTSTKKYFCKSCTLIRISILFVTIRPIQGDSALLKQTDTSKTGNFAYTFQFCNITLEVLS